MSSPILATLREQIQRSTTVQKSASLAFKGFGQRLTDAIAAATANGATAEELEPIRLEAEAMTAAADELAADVVANTPAA